MLFSPNNDELVNLEIDAIQDNQVLTSLYKDPFVTNNLYNKKTFNLLSNFSDQLSFEPTFAIRYSQFGF